MGAWYFPSVIRVGLTRFQLAQLREVPAAAEVAS
jgi:hypothetical protein